MKQITNTNYRTEMEAFSHYTLKDSLLQNSLQSKKALYSSRLSKDNLSNNYIINSRGKSYDPKNRNQDLISSEIGYKNSSEIPNYSSNSLINRHSLSKNSPTYTTTSLEMKKYNLNMPNEDAKLKSTSFSNYSRLSINENLNKSSKFLTNFLPDRSSHKINKKTLILDLDETLVHSAFNQFYMKSDIILNIELDRKINVIHVLKRPGVDEFLFKMAKHYEVVIFTASVSAYANPLINQLDTRKCVSHRLFRDHCTFLNGNFIKDMKKLGRNLKDVIILDVRF